MVSVHIRPWHLATDEASTEAVMLEFMQHVSFDVLGLVQATSPLTKASDLASAKSMFIEHQLDSLFSACPFKRFLWTSSGQPLNYDPTKRPRRQEITDYWLLENGAFYLTRREILKSQGCRLAAK